MCEATCSTVGPGPVGADTLSEGEVDAPLVDLFSGGPSVDTCTAGAEDPVLGCE
jgi:hypothetical protein